MRERNKIILEYGTYMLSFFVSYIASLAKWYYASGIILIVEAVYLYVHWVRESGSFVELRALFTLAWVGGQGISCLKLSTLQDTWSYITWLSFFVIYIAFGIGYEWGRKYSRVEGKEPEKNKKKANRLFRCIMLLLVVSAGCFPDRLYSGFFRRTLFVFLFQNVGFTLSSLLCNQLYPDTGTYGALEKNRF